MKGLIWLGAFTIMGVIVGAIPFALTPARFRSVTTLQVKAVNNRTIASFDGLLDNLARPALDESRMESLMRDLGLYRRERASGRFADAMLDLRRGAALSRHTESANIEHWTVAFEATNPIDAQRASARIASLIEADFERLNPDPEPDPVLDPLIHEAVTRLKTSEAKIKAWNTAHGGRQAPSSMRKEYDSLLVEAFELVKRDPRSRIGSEVMDFEPIGLEVSIVNTSRLTTVGPRPLSFIATRAAAGLLAGVITLPFFLRRQR